jgi:hypothetical protein
MYISTYRSVIANQKPIQRRDRAWSTDSHYNVDTSIGTFDAVMARLSQNDRPNMTASDDSYQQDDDTFQTTNKLPNISNMENTMDESNEVKEQIPINSLSMSSVINDLNDEDSSNEEDDYNSYEDEEFASDNEGKLDDDNYEEKRNAICKKSMSPDLDERFEKYEREKPKIMSFAGFIK